MTINRHVLSGCCWPALPAAAPISIRPRSCRRCGCSLCRPRRSTPWPGRPRPSRRSSTALPAARCNSPGRGARCWGSPTTVTSAPSRTTRRKRCWRRPARPHRCPRSIWAQGRSPLSRTPYRPRCWRPSAGLAWMAKSSTAGAGFPSGSRCAWPRGRRRSGARPSSGCPSRRARWQTSTPYRALSASICRREPRLGRRRHRAAAQTAGQRAPRRRRRGAGGDLCSKRRRRRNGQLPRDAPLHLVCRAGRPRQPPHAVHRRRRHAGRRHRGQMEAAGDADDDRPMSRLFVVVRDDRGGVGWSSATASLEATP